MSLTTEDVARVANLARLELTQEELELYCGQLSAVLDYFARIDELHLDDVPPTTRAVPAENIMRDDIIRPSLPLEDVMLNANRQHDDQFVVQPLLDV